MACMWQQSGKSRGNLDDVRAGALLANFAGQRVHHVAAGIPQRLGGQCVTNPREQVVATYVQAGRTQYIEHVLAQFLELHLRRRLCRAIVLAQDVVKGKEEEGAGQGARAGESVRWSVCAEGTRRLLPLGSGLIWRGRPMAFPLH